ncbi:MAG TPA: hypothetical protein VF952_01965 [Chloroflexia bacterium]|jgi:hypothetical protein
MSATDVNARKATNWFDADVTAIALGFFAVFLTLKPLVANPSRPAGVLPWSIGDVLFGGVALSGVAAIILLCGYLPHAIALFRTEKRHINGGMAAVALGVYAVFLALEPIFPGQVLVRIFILGTGAIAIAVFVLYALGRPTEAPLGAPGSYWLSMFAIVLLILSMAALEIALLFL